MREHLQFWVSVAAYYQKKPEDMTLRAYCEHSKGFDVSQLKQAFEAHLQSEEAKFFPTPGHLLQFLKRPEIKQDDLGVEVAGLIFKCIRKYGHMQANAARHAMGDLAWEVVESFGGWHSLCSNTNSSNITSTRAQLRELTNAKVRRKRAGFDDKIPSLEDVARRRLDDNKGLLQ